MVYKWIILSLLLLVCAGKALACDEPTVFFLEPKDGAVVEKTFVVKMAADAIEVAPAGEVKENSGHHHIIVDGTFIKKGETVPKDAQHKHFGKGQVETSLTLSKGEHTLTLQFADGMHTSYGSTMSQTIKITVK